MASSRAKLSLRRTKKQNGSSRPEPPNSVNKGGASRGVDDPVERDSASRDHMHNDRMGTGEMVCEDFRPSQPPSRAGKDSGLGRKRKRQPNEPTSYLDVEQLQLAMALSASMQPHPTPVDPAPLPLKGKRGKRSKANERDLLPTSVITTSSAESQRILAQKASAMLHEVLGSGGAACVPSLHPSQLAKRLREFGPPPEGSSTLWEMASYAEREGKSKFLVPALNLPPTERRKEPSSDDVMSSHTSPPHPTLLTQDLPVSSQSQIAHHHIHFSQPSPASHTHILHSPLPSPPAVHSHLSHSPLPSPPSPHTHISTSQQPSLTTNSHISHSPRPSQIHISHSPQPSLTAHTHISHSPQPLHARISHSSQPSQTTHHRSSHSPCPQTTHHHSSHSPHPQPSQTTHHHSSHSPHPQPSHTSHLHPSPTPTLPRNVQTLLSDLNYLVGSQLCSDVIITVADGRGIPAHSAILACRCPMLAERLFHCLDKPVHLDFSQFDRATVVTFLRYLYTGTIPHHQNGMKSVTMLAMSLGMVEPSLPAEKREPLPVHSTTEVSSSREREGCHKSESGSGEGVGSDSVRGEGCSSEGLRGEGVWRAEGETTFQSRRVLSTDQVSAAGSDSMQCGMRTSGGDITGTTDDSASHTPHPLTQVRSTEAPSPAVPHIATPTPDSPATDQVPVKTASRDVISVSSSPPCSPHHSTSPPHHSTSPPHHSTSPPHHSTSPPHHSTSPPHHSTSPPHHSTSPPHHSPHHSTFPPHHSTSPPHPSTSPPAPAPLLQDKNSSPQILSSPDKSSQIKEDLHVDTVSSLSSLQEDESSPPPRKTFCSDSSNLEMTPSPRPLQERISNVPLTTSVTVCDGIVAVALCDTAVMAEPDTGCVQSSLSDDIVTLSATPATLGPRPVLESDTDVTPMADYQNMATPLLKGECSKFGVRALPKRKMIAKLEEIYNYTHPLTDTDGNIVVAVPPETSTTSDKKTVCEEADRRRGKGRGRGREKTSEQPSSSQTLPSSQKLSLEELVSKVREVITMDTELCENVLLYKPLELSHIQCRLKAAALSLSRESLMDVLDHLCVTFSVPRQHQQQRTT